MPLNKLGAAADLLGLGTNGGGLKKLTITKMAALTNRPDYDVEVTFNPHEISRSRSVSWQRQKVAGGSGTGSADEYWQYVGVDTERLTVELFFDTYESRAQDSGWKQSASLVTPLSPFQTGDATDVTTLTDKVYKLAEIDPDLHTPPVCRLSWGRSELLFEGFLTQVEQRFTMFLPDGTPVRATLSCSFDELTTVAKQRALEGNSADVAKTRVVRRTDTLHAIAAQEYGDPALWRHIARANGVLNPRTLRPGTVLTIPKLTGGGAP
jgi:nucleoid-associated protein YgaU